MDKATAVKLQVMKITAMLLTEPTDIAIIAIIAIFISNHVILLCGHVQHTSVLNL